MSLPKNKKVEILENQMAHQKIKHFETNITISQGVNKITFSRVKQSMSAITQSDIQKLKNVPFIEKGKLLPVIGPIFKFFRLVVRYYWHLFHGHRLPFLGMN